MENNTNHDSASDCTNEKADQVDSGEMNDANDESYKDDNGKDETTKGSEDRVGHGSKIDDKGEETEENGEEENEASPEHGEQVCKSSDAAVANISTGKTNTCPVAPTRQRKKSRASSDTVQAEKKTQEEKAQGESESHEKEKEGDEDKREGETVANNVNEEKITGNTSEQKEIKSPYIEDTNVTEVNSVPIPIRRHRKGIEKPNQRTEKDKDTNLEEGKGDMTIKEVNDEKKSLVGLKKELGLANCVGIMVGNIIGTGIFVTPGAVLQYTGSVGLSIIVWIVSGLVTIVGAFCYAELGTMIPESGGNYTYLHEAFGPLPAFLYLWMFVMVGIPGGRAVVALTFANYVTQPFFDEGVKPPDAALKMIGILLIVTLTYISSRRVRWTTTVQDSLAMTKVLALIMIIVVGLFHLSRSTTENYDDPMAGSVTDPAYLVTAFYHTFFAYDGWDSLNSIMEELKDPFRNMPRAIAISVVTVMVIYVLTNVAYFAVVPKDLMLTSPAVAVTFGNLALGVMAWTIPIFVACSIMGGLNGGIMLSSRLVYVSSRRGQLPRALSLVHVNNSTPVTALVFVACMSMVMFVTSDVRVLINYTGFSGSLMNLACICSFFWFRVKKPEMARPIKVWMGFPIIYTILSFCLCVFPVVRQPIQVLAALLILGSGVPVYYLLVNSENRPQRLASAMDKITYVCQVLFLAAPEEKAT